MRRYRSGHSIIPFVEKMRQALAHCNFTWELVLVGNYIKGSEDETPQVIAELAEKIPNVRTVIRPKEGMMGWDMRMGLNAGFGPEIFSDATSRVGTGSWGGSRMSS